MNSPENLVTIHTKSVDLPLYQSIKQVRGAKIVNINIDTNHFGDKLQFWDIRKGCRPQNEDGSCCVVLEVGDVHAFVILSLDFYKRHRPQVGGWLVDYGNGYKSYSRSDAFEPCHVLLGDAAHQFDSVTDDLPTALSTLFRMTLVLSTDDAWNRAVGNPAGSDASARNSYLNRFKTYCKNLWMTHPDRIKADSYNKDLADALTPVQESK